MAQNFNSQKLYDAYEIYKESNISYKRFSHDEIIEYYKEFGNKDFFRFQEIGRSLEGRSINMISFGTGSINILAWSQMHGDESTATMALVDLLSFFAADDELNNLRDEILSKVTINIIPMLNPDGAEKYKRRNALHIDLNRDAQRLQFPESRALKSVRDSLNAEFGFNLHDQSTRYTSGYTYKAATISFLAPAFNYEKDINEVRANTMKVIVNIFDELSEFIPGHIARYDDEFEPRAFGDNMMKWGTGSILIESGGWKNNHEKQFIRKLNFLSLVVGFQSIAHENYKNADINRYNKIPENKKRLFDLLLRNASVEYNGKKYIVDIGINNNEVGTADARDDYFKGTIEDVGDLSTFYGYDEYNLSGMTIAEGKIYPNIFNSLSDVEEVDFDSLYREGYTTVMVDSVSDNEKFTASPICIISSGIDFKNEIGIDKPANFIVYQNNKVRFIIINGFLYDLLSGDGDILNGIILE